MNLKMGSQNFVNVQIPLLWGKRAVIQDSQNRISIISLEGNEAKIEILADQPAPDIEYELIEENGIKIFFEGKALYSYSPKMRTITPFSLNLPECEIQESHTRIGTNIFSKGTVIGSGVGLIIDETGFGMGGPLPEGIAKLKV